MRLFGALEQFGGTPALIDADGIALTHQELANAADSLVVDLPPRQLVLCLCSNSVDAIVGYVGLVRNGHVCVMLAAGTDPERIKEFSRLFSPNQVYAPAEILRELELDPQLIFGSYGIARTRYATTEMHQDLTLLMTTSGSTGSPMLVRVSNDNLVENAASIAESLGLTAHDRALTTLPMNYTYGLSIINSQLQVGGSLVVCDASLMDRQFWNLVSTSGATYFGGVPYTYQMLERIGIRRLANGTLRMLTQAGGKLDEASVKRIHSACAEVGIEFNVMYGQTEATARMSVLKSSEVQGHPWSIGRPIPGGSMRVVDPDTGESAGSGEVGELEYLGPNVTMGYATSRADLVRGDDFGFSLRTGDLAIQGDDGYFRIVGRRKRFIKVYGSRVNLDDVERMVQESGLEAVCTGSDDSLVVHIVGDVDREGLKEAVASFIGTHKNAVRVNPVGSIPRAESGKVLYSELMEDSNG